MVMGTKNVLASLARVVAEACIMCCPEKEASFNVGNVRLPMHYYTRVTDAVVCLHGHRHQRAAALNVPMTGEGCQGTWVWHVGFAPGQGPRDGW